MTENEIIAAKYNELLKQGSTSFPNKRQPINITSDQGVYIIRYNDRILHVGRTTRASEGLKQRIKNHLYGSSSFTKNFLNGDGSILRQNSYNYQYLVVEDDRKRALLEALSTGKLCPEYIGLSK